MFYRPGSDEFQATWQAVVDTLRLPHLYQTAPPFIIDRAALFTWRLRGSDYLFVRYLTGFFVLLLAESNTPLIRQRGLDLHADFQTQCQKMSENMDSHG
jgi:hypothetical protein